MKSFEAGKLPKAEWTHEAHLIMAIWSNTYYAESEILNRVRENIIQHNESVGTPNSETEGYHETLTQFWLWVAGRYLDQNKVRSMLVNCNAFINSPFANRKYPFEYYSFEQLFSVEARLSWAEPDLNPMQELIVP